MAGPVLVWLRSRIEYRSLPSQTTLDILLSGRKFCINLYVDINPSRWVRLVIIESFVYVEYECEGSGIRRSASVTEC